MKNKGFCTELVPGANHLIKAEEKDSGPPEGFINNTVYVYKMIEGEKVLVRTEDPFLAKTPEESKRVPTFSPNGAKIHSEFMKAKGEADMSKKYDWDTLWPQAKEMLDRGESAKEVSKKIGVEISVLQAKIYREKKTQQTPEPKKGIGINQDFENAFPKPKKEQTPKPEPETVGSQDPAQSTEESANTSISYGAPFDELVPPVNMPLGVELPKENQYNSGNNDFGPEDDEPIPYILGCECEAGKSQAFFNLAASLAEHSPFNMDSYKLSILDAIRERSGIEKAPAEITLAMMGAVLDLEVG